MPVILGGNTSISLSSFPQGIETDNLVLYLDAGNPTSYPGTGNIWFDISGSSNNSTLVNSPTFSSANQGSFLFYSLTPALLRGEGCGGNVKYFVSVEETGYWFFL